MKPFIKWAGGKYSELKNIKKYFPKEINRYIEPFVGGGAVYLNIENISSNYLINDKSENLTSLYRFIKNSDETLFAHLNRICDLWEEITSYTEEQRDKLILIYKDYYSNKEVGKAIEVERETILKRLNESNNEKLGKEITKSFYNKFKRMEKIDRENGSINDEAIINNIEALLKSAYYMYLRDLHNHPEKYKLAKEEEIAVFYFIREFCYSSMFRYNKIGEFNVPYGGISYNRKDFRGKINKLSDKDLSGLLEKTTIYSLDFEDFLKEVSPTKGDFIFLDPPYDSAFSTYDNNEFNRDDHIRLANLMRDTEANFMLVIKNTDFIYELYKDFNIISFDKKYMVSFKNRNDKEVEHLVITNF